MPNPGGLERFFFGYGDERAEMIFDEEAYELIGDKEARRLALEGLTSIAKDAPSDRDDWTACVGVKDDNGDLIYMATLAIHGAWLRSKT